MPLPLSISQGMSIVSVLGLRYETTCFSGGSVVKNLLAKAGDAGWILSREDSLEKEMATHSSILTGKIPWTEEPSGLQYMRPQESLNHNMRQVETTSLLLFILQFSESILLIAFCHLSLFSTYSRMS